MPSNEKKYICTKPFQWLEIGENGECWLCCPEWLKKPIGNIDTAWNSKEAQEIRDSMYDGSFKHCNDSCPFKKTKTGPVREINALIEQQPKFASLIENKTTELDYGPKQINASYDRSCNLSCPSCRTKVIIETGDKKTQILEIQEKMLSIMDDTEWLCITGSGDPFGSPHFRKLLREFEPTKYPKLKAIHLHTNGMLWDKEMWDTMQNIHNFVKSAEISIDAATKETYEINRRGGNWDKLMQNIDWINTLGLTIKISMVVQENNYAEMPAFVELGRNKYDFDVYFGKLVDWQTYDNYEARAIHLAWHPKHGELVDMLKRDIFKQPRVTLGNLSDVQVYQILI